MSLAEAIHRRRSVRDFSAEAIFRHQLSQILWVAQGVGWEGYRSVPSAGATFPLEIVVAAGEGGVEGLDAGLYRYLPEGHSLSRHYAGDVRRELAAAALGQESIYEAPVDIIIGAVRSRTLTRYGARGEGYVYMEAGHAGQNIYLQATALGLGTVAIGAFRDEAVIEVLRLGGEYRTLYIMPIGKPA